MFWVMTILAVVWCKNYLPTTTASVLHWGGDMSNLGMGFDTKNNNLNKKNQNSDMGMSLEEVLYLEHSFPHRRVTQQPSDLQQQQQQPEEEEEHDEYEEQSQSTRRRRNDRVVTTAHRRVFPGTTTNMASTYARIPNSSTSMQLVNRVKMWPPWPLSLISTGEGRGGDSDDAISSSSSSSSSAHNGNISISNKMKSEHNKERDQAVTASNTYPSAAAIALAWVTQRTRIGIRQLQEIGSTLWFHLPPTLPPLMVVASIPRKISTTTTMTAPGGSSAATTKKIIPLFRDPLARNLLLSGMGIAVLSWAHQELHRRRKLTPLLGGMTQQSVSKVFLPPFLPELVPEPEIEALQQSSTPPQPNGSQATNDEGSTSTNREADEEEESTNQILSMMRPRFRKHLTSIHESNPLAKHRRHGRWAEWKRRRETRRREVAKIRRLSVFDELIALQAIKRKQAQRSKTSDSNAVSKTGYALVTGASQGIGRALAVELARWEIPLVLVARDVDRLTSLAYDLEACYGVRCCVLQADLSESDAAERIYESTQQAGLTIDILINNAGIAFEGLSTDLDTSSIEQMIVINTMSFAKLSNLFGNDMKKRKRGRMLMVSSVAGATSASPNAALYGATKAFEKSLSLSMSKELESHGVGVTCIMPGPVRDTQFQSRSGTGKALCWYIPFYARPAETVAHQGIMSLLDGDTQVIPGWQNRAFIQLFRPILPQRIETVCVQAAWSPLRWPTWRSLLLRSSGTESDKNELRDFDSSSSSGGFIDSFSSDSVHLDLRPRYNYQLPPRLLQLPQKEEEAVATSSFEEETTVDQESMESSPSSESSSTISETPIPTPTVQGQTQAPSSSNDAEIETSSFMDPPHSTSSPLREPVNPVTTDNSSASERQYTSDPNPKPEKVETKVPTPVYSGHNDFNSVKETKPSEETITPPSSQKPILDFKKSSGQAVNGKSNATGKKEHSQYRDDNLETDIGEDEEDILQEEDMKPSHNLLSPRLGPVDLFHGLRPYTTLPKAATPMEEVDGYQRTVEV